MSKPVPNAWGIETDDGPERADQETRITDFLAFFALAFASLPLPMDLPLGESAALGLGLLTLVRDPRREIAVPTWFVLLVLAVPGWLAMSAMLNDAYDLRRLAHLASCALLASAMATGRISIPSAARGLACGFPLSAAAAIAGVGGQPNDYPDRLSGWIGDPNTAAMYLSVLGLLAMASTRGWTRWLLGAFLVVAVILTFSRTGVLVLIATLLWLVAGRRLKVPAGVAAVAAVAWLTRNIPDDLRLWGPFSGRDGSDALRDRIVAAEQFKLDQAPWWGNGPGTSVVEVAGQDFFFHSSYYGVINEGGWILLVMVLALVIGTFLAIGRHPDPADRLGAALLQMSLIAALLMAFTLGEVLLDLPLAIVVGAGIRHAYRRGARPAPPDSEATHPHDLVRPTSS